MRDGATTVQTMGRYFLQSGLRFCADEMHKAREAEVLQSKLK